MDEIKIAVQELTCSAEDKKYFEAFFIDFSSSCDKPASITEAPKYLKSKIIADAKKTYTASTSRRETNEKRVDKSRSSVREGVSKFKLSRTSDDKQSAWKSTDASSLRPRRENSRKLPHTKNVVRKRM